MSPASPAPNSALAAARQLGDRLHAVMARGSADPLGVLLAEAFRVIEAETARAFAATSVACHAGCSWCCRQLVSATAPEVLAVAAAIAAEPPGRRGPRRAALRRAAGEVAGLDIAARWRLRRQCPLLEPDGRCGVYAHRPLACRGQSSRDATACRSAPEDGRRIPVVRDAKLAALAVGYAVEHALAAAGLPRGQYELVQAVTLALEMGPREARRRFLSGEDVLAPARLPDTVPI